MKNSPPVGDLRWFLGEDEGELGCMAGPLFGMWCGHCDLHRLQRACSPGKRPARAPQPRAGGLGGVPESDLACRRSRRFRSMSASTTRWGSPAPCTASLRLPGTLATASGPQSCSPVASRFDVKRTRHWCVRRGAASATLYFDAGDMPTAERHYREALALGLQEGDVRLRVYCLAVLACVAVQNEDANLRPAAHGLSPSGSKHEIRLPGWSRPTESATACAEVRYPRPWRDVRVPEQRTSAETEGRRAEAAQSNKQLPRH